MHHSHSFLDRLGKACNVAGDILGHLVCFMVF